MTAESTTTLAPEATIEPSAARAQTREALLADWAERLTVSLIDIDGSSAPGAPHPDDVRAFLGRFLDAALPTTLAARGSACCRGMSVSRLSASDKNDAYQGAKILFEGGDKVNPPWVEVCHRISDDPEDDSVWSVQVTRWHAPEDEPAPDSR